MVSDGTKNVLGISGCLTTQNMETKFISDQAKYFVSTTSKKPFFLRMQFNGWSFLYR